MKKAEDCGIVEGSNVDALMPRTSSWRLTNSRVIGTANFPCFSRIYE